MDTQLQIPFQPRVLVIGSGAREHAITWKLAESPYQPRLYAAPGNPGMHELAQCVEIGVEEIGRLVDFAISEHIDMLVIGPENPLSLGLADACLAQGLRVIGPTQAAAQLESSKAYAKEVMENAQVPTAQYAAFTDAQAAMAYVRKTGAPIVVKADGLAAGKGVVVAQTVDEALAAIEDMLIANRFGQAGAQVILEECMSGEEVSLMFFVDGQTVQPMLAARDHKRVGDEDTGPNTGGMGVYAPVPGFSAEDVRWVEGHIVIPTLTYLMQQGIEYRGILYVGLMLTSSGLKVVEFNARFGDPETEVVLPLLETDLLEIFWAISEQALADVKVQWKTGAAVCVVAAAKGYPEAPRKNDEIQILQQEGRSAIIFHAGTKQEGEKLLTAGGRVLAVVGLGTHLEEARLDAYRHINQISFADMHFRRDIAKMR